MHIVRFPFSLPEGLSPNEALFLGQTPAWCDSLPHSVIQLYGALHPAIRTKSGEKKGTYRPLGQPVLSRLDTVGGSTLWVGCVLFFPSFLCWTKEYSQFSLLLRPNDTRYNRLFSVSSLNNICSTGT